MTAVEVETQKPTLVGMNAAAMAALAERVGASAYRGKQLAQWVYGKSVAAFDEMANLPAGLRDAVAGAADIHPLSPDVEQRSNDGVVKLLLRTHDGQGVEAVYLDCGDRVSSCVSSQVGCALRCTFCATGLGGYTRNLSAGEIVDQILWLQRAGGKRIDHVSFMGMGEPLLNLNEVLGAVALLHGELGLSYRRVHISTVGIVPKIRELADAELPIHLAVSLHSPTDSVRAKLMPVTRKWPVHEVVAAAREYAEKTGRKVNFEYLLLDGVNDTVEQARRLAGLIGGIPCVVNLIPFNRVDTEQGYRRPPAARIHRFRAELERLRVNVTQRVERGQGIDAACGQLRGKHDGKPIPIGPARELRDR
jgi:23S rRNA (adenine2503-C2)-methyltransferase